MKRIMAKGVQFCKEIYAKNKIALEARVLVINKKAGKHRAKFAPPSPIKLFIFQ